MDVEGTFGYKRLVAHAALERPFAGVCFHVNLQVVFSRVSLVADGAGKRLDGTVSGLVLVEVAL